MSQCGNVWRLGFAVTFLGAGSAWAGPPFLTDDPEPVEYRHFEINSAVLGTRYAQGVTGATPSIDINYGLIPNVQFHVNLSVPYHQADNQALYAGYGDTELGVKYRFIEEDGTGWRPQLALYPLIEIPTGSDKTMPGTGYNRTFLPMWLQKSWGEWTSYGGGGYWFNTHADNRDYWFAGWLVQRQITERLALGGEVFEQGKNAVGSHVSGGFNLGGKFDLDEAEHILFSAGRGLRDVSDTNIFSYYLAYQLTF